MPSFITLFIGCSVGNYFRIYLLKNKRHIRRKLLRVVFGYWLAMAIKQILSICSKEDKVFVLTCLIESFFLSLQPINTHTFDQYQQYEWSFYDKRDVEVLSFNISHGFCADTIKGYNICFNQTQVTRINNYIFCKVNVKH